MKLFQSATLKLTLWYLAVLMLVSIGFSVVIFQISSREFDRPLSPDMRIRYYAQGVDIEALRQQRAEESERSLLLNLVGLNIATLILGAGASYAFARRTLTPIEEAMEAQTRFVSDASHELRTPLAVMKTENEIALRGKDMSKTEYKSVVESNLEEVGRLQALTDRLLALSSAQVLPLGNFPIDEAIQPAIERHASVAKQRHITFVHQVGALQAYGNHDSVCDIISVLIDNALKYSPDKTTVTLTAVEDGRHIVVTVSDQGSGIAAEDLPHVFDRFYRADVSRSKANSEGHGLGLALAKHLAELNEAQLSVANNADRGAIFSLRLNKAR